MLSYQKEFSKLSDDAKAKKLQMLDVPDVQVKVPYDEQDKDIYDEQEDWWCECNKSFNSFKWFYR